MKKLKPSVSRDFVFRQCSETPQWSRCLHNEGEPTADSLAVVRYVVSHSKQESAVEDMGGRLSLGDNVLASRKKSRKVALITESIFSNAELRAPHFLTIVISEFLRTRLDY
jgi:hypothetical protein